ncbi:MAG: hypothetical protein Q9M22_07840 [Mariprofundaceae bacterium]|nr:hypothetical protein [Mariprofundaceae bacterium]
MHKSACIKLANIATLCLQGTGARDYLQSQFTQDVARLSTSQGIYGAVLTPQGKMIADARVIQINEHTLWMLHETAVSEALLKRMRMFALGHELTVTLLPLTIEGYYGNAAKSLLWPMPNNTPALVTRTEGKETLLANADFMQGCWRMVSDEHPLKLSSFTMEETSLYAQRVSKGIPRFTVDCHVGDYPLNANLREFNGISFDKGCYVGQEISSRMHWRKGVRHALYHISLSSLPVACPCDTITSATIGRLSSCAASGDGIYGIARLPATMMDDTTNNRDLLHTVDGVAIRILKKCSLEL